MMQEQPAGYRGPKFTGNPAMFVTFLLHFRDYCLLNVAGVKSLHAMRSRKPLSWYPRLEHVGTGRTYHCTDTSDGDEEDLEETLSDEYAANVSSDQCPAYSSASTASDKKKVREADSEARRLLAAQLRTAVSGCATAKSRLQKSDPDDGVSGMLTLWHFYTTQRTAANTHVELKTLLYEETYGSGTIKQFLDRIEKCIVQCDNAKVPLTEIDKYGAVIRGIERTDPAFAGQIKGTLATADEALQDDPYSFVTAHLLADFPNRVAEGSYTTFLANQKSFLAKIEELNRCQSCGKKGHTAKNCNERKARARQAKSRRPRRRSESPARKTARQKKEDGTYIPTPEFRRQQAHLAGDVAPVQFHEFERSGPDGEHALMAKSAAGTTSDEHLLTPKELVVKEKPPHQPKHWYHCIAIALALAAVLCALAPYAFSEMQVAAGEAHIAHHTAHFGKALKGPTPVHRLVPAALNSSVEHDDLTCDTDEWILDSGASDYFATCYASFDPKTYVPVPKSPANRVTVGNNAFVDIIGRGDIPALITYTAANGTKSTFRTKIPGKHTPGMCKNLFSVKKAWAKSFDIVLSQRLGNYVDIGAIKIPVDMNGSLPVIKIVTGPAAQQPDDTRAVQSGNMRRRQQVPKEPYVPAIGNLRAQSVPAMRHCESDTDSDAMPLLRPGSESETDSEEEAYSKDRVQQRRVNRSRPRQIPSRSGKLRPNVAAALHVLDDPRATDASRIKILRRIHRICGHCNLKDLRETVRKGRVSVPPGWKDALLQPKLPKLPCPTCTKAKSRKLGRATRHTHRDASATAAVPKLKVTPATPASPGVLISVDVKELRTATQKSSKSFPPGKRYCVGFHDNSCGYLFPRFVTNRGALDTALDDYVQFLYVNGIIRDLHQSGITLICDNEMIKGVFHRVMKQYGIKPQPSPPGEHHRNPFIERAWDTLFNMANAMLLDAELPAQLIEQATLDAADKLNAIGRPQYDYVTANEAYFGKRSSWENLNIFGSMASVYIDSSQRNKGDDKAMMMLLVGSSPLHAHSSSPPAKFLNPETVRYVLSANYTVYERHEHADHDVMDLIHAINRTGAHSRGDRRERIVAARRRRLDQAQPHGANVATAQIKAPALASAQSNASVVQSMCPPGARKVGSKRTAAVRRRRAQGVAAEYRAYVATVSDKMRRQRAADRAAAVKATPRNERHARRMKNWKTEWLPLFRQEWLDLMESGTFRYVDRSAVPDNADIIGSTTDFKVKFEHGVETKKRVRFCPMGNQQTPGKSFDPHCTSSPVVDRRTRHCMMAKSALTGRQIDGFDVTKAFPHAYPGGEENVYVRVPKEFERIGKDGLPMVVIVEKAAYGLMTSAHDFNVAFSEWLLDLGFTRNHTDPGAFHYNDGSMWIDCNIHVDDGEYMASDDELAAWFREAIEAEFHTKFESCISFSLGAGIVQCNNTDGTRTVALDMSDAIEELAFSCDVSNDKAVENPVKSGVDYATWSAVSDKEHEEVLALGLRRVIGTLIHIVYNARPDATCAVNMVSRFQSRASHALFDACIRIVQYLYCTRHKLLTYTARPCPRNTITVEFFCDASNVPCAAPGKKYGMSTTGIAVFVSGAGAAVDWYCLRQTCVARNSTEAEIIASTDCTPKITTWRNYLEAAGHAQKAATCLWLDNEANVKNMFNMSATGTQHLNKRQAYSRDMVARIQLRPQAIPGKLNCSDALTKSLPTPAFTTHADTLLGITHARTMRSR